MTKCPSRQSRLAAVTLVIVAGAAGAQGTPFDSAAEGRMLRVVRDSIPGMMRRMAVPGTVVTILRGDRTLMNEGFGVADVARRIPVDADRTVFRVASVAKAFTAMAALRLTAAGRLPLDADIAQWVPDVALDAPPETPMTVAQLLTHTAGIDERLLRYLDPPGIAPPPLGEFLPRYMPPRTRMPDSAPAYSNHGYALVGLIVERITHTPFDAFVRDSLLAPLGMSRTSFVMRPSLDTVDHALEYTSEGDLRVMRSSRPYPAGNIGTTGGDMTRFLAVLLRQPRDSATALMMSAALQYHPEMPPTGYGLAATDMMGRRVWMKGGAGPSHSAVIAVIPELNIGIFVALNRQEPTLWDELLPMMLAAYGPPASAVATAGAPATSAPDVDGDYLWTRAGLGSFEKVLGLATQIRVHRDGDRLTVTGPFSSGTYQRDGSLRFRRADSVALAFRIGETGSATRAFTVTVGQPVSFERIPLHRTTRFQLAIVAGSSVLAFGAGLLTLKRKPAGELQPTWSRVAVIALPVAQLATVGSALVLSRQGDQLFQGPTSGLYATLAMTTVTAAVGLAQSAGSVTLAQRARSNVARTTYAVSAAAGVGLTWFLAANNLIGFRF